MTILFRKLETANITISPQKYLQIQQLLEKLPENTSNTDLKYMLATLLTTSKEKQNHFYQLFDASEKEIEKNTFNFEQKKEKIAPKINPNRNRWYPILNGLGAILVGLLIWLGVHLITGSEERTEENTLHIVANINSTVEYCMEGIFGDTIIEYFALANGGYEGNTINYGYYELDTIRHCISYTSYDQTGENVDTITLIAYTQGLGESYTYLIPSIHDETAEANAERNNNPTETSPPITQNKDLLHPKDYPYNADLSRLFLEEPSEWYYFWQRVGTELKILFPIILAIFFIVLGLWFNSRRKLIIENSQTEEPPYIWDIRLDNEDDLIYNDNFHQTLNQLRKRTKDDIFNLNLPKTIQKTIDNAGIVSLEYEQATKPSEYLILIDQQHSQNHQAKLFDAVYQGFKAQEVYIERFFFDSDVRLCYNEENRFGVHIKDILQKFNQSRLLIFGNGYQLINPRSGKLAPWTKIFDGWKEKAILSPIPSEKWGRKERFLSKEFSLFPSTMDGLRLTLDYFDGAGSDDFQRIKKLKSASLAPITFDGNLISTIKKHYENAFANPNHKSDLGVWIAACAVYPKLNWDLTLHLGKFLSDENQPLTTTEQILQLSRLPWFVEGQIPEDARKVLIEWLETNQPKLLQDIRQEINHVLLQTHPPVNSIAHDDHRMNLVTNALLTNPPKKKQKALEEEFQTLSEKGVEHDFTIIKYLNRKQTPFDHVVPDGMRKYIFKGGWSGFGWQPIAWLAPLWLVLSTFLWLYNPQAPSCNGETLYFHNIELCLHPDSPEHRMIFWEHLIIDSIENVNLAGVDSIVQEAKSFANENDLDTIPFLKNIATAFYNAGAKDYNLFLESNETIFEESACNYFRNAFDYDSLDYDLLVMLDKCNVIKLKPLEIASIINVAIINAENQQIIKNARIFHETENANIFPLEDGSFDLQLQSYNQPTITLSFSANGFENKAVTFHIDSNRTSLPNVELTPISQNTKTPLKGQLRIYGKVLGQQQQPLANVLVTYGEDQTRTDEKGQYSLSLAKELKQDVYYDIAGYSVQRMSADFSNAMDIVLIDRAYTTIEIYLQDESGQPIKDATIIFQQTKGKFEQLGKPGEYSHQLEHPLIKLQSASLTISKSGYETEGYTFSANELQNLNNNYKSLTPVQVDLTLKKTQQQQQQSDQFGFNIQVKGYVYNVTNGKNQPLPNTGISASNAQPTTATTTGRFTLKFDPDVKYGANARLNVSLPTGYEVANENDLIVTLSNRTNELSNFIYVVQATSSEKVFYINKNFLSPVCLNKGQIDLNKTRNYILQYFQEDYKKRYGRLNTLSSGTDFSFEVAGLNKEVSQNNGETIKANFKLKSTDDGLIVIFQFTGTYLEQLGKKGASNKKISGKLLEEYNTKIANQLILQLSQTF